MILSTLERSIEGTIGYMSDFWALTTATEQVEYPASNLLTPDLNQKWVSWGQRASHNWIELQSDSKNAARSLYLAVLLGIDRHSPTQPDTGSFSVNSYRMIVDSLWPVASRRRPAVETVSLTNLTGAVSLLNGPIDPPNLVPTGYVSTKMTSPNAAANTILVADFFNHNATERALADTEQTIRIHYTHSANPEFFPILDFKIRYNSVTSGSSIVADDIEQTSEGYIFTYHFDPATVGGFTGRIGIQVTGNTNGSSTPLPIGVEFIAELEGWGTDDESWDSLIDTRVGENITFPQIIELPRNEDDDPYDIPANTALYLYLEVSDWVEELEFLRTPLGGHEGKAFFAGRIIATQGLSVDLKHAGGYNRRKVSDIGIIRTRGGSFRGLRNPLHWDEHDFSTRIQAQELVVSDLESFFERAGMRNPIVIVPDETIPGQAIYGILTRWETTDVGAWVPPGGVSDQYCDLSFSAIDARARQTLR